MPNNYIFPDIIGSWLAKVDTQTQLEATMLSTLFMAIGLIVTSIVVIPTIPYAFWFKLFAAFNALAGTLFMWSSLTTTFQQYQAYMVVKSLNISITSEKPILNIVKGGKNGKTKI